jgi:hypothetical protein
MRRLSILRVPILATSLTQLVGANLGFLRSLAFRGAPFLGILVHGTHSGDQGKDSDPSQWAMPPAKPISTRSRPPSIQTRTPPRRFISLR